MTDSARRARTETRVRVGDTLMVGEVPVRIAWVRGKKVGLYVDGGESVRVVHGDAIPIDGDSRKPDNAA